MKNNANYSAFPRTTFNSHGALTSFDERYQGLTKREYFAIKSLQGLCAGRTEYEDPMVDVKDAVKLADKLIEELNKTI